MIPTPQNLLKHLPLLLQKIHRFFSKKIDTLKETFIPKHQYPLDITQKDPLFVRRSSTIVQNKKHRSNHRAFTHFFTQPPSEDITRTDYPPVTRSFLPYRATSTAKRHPSYIHHFNTPFFPESRAIIRPDYCQGGHQPSINKAEERWQQVGALTPTAPPDVEESRFRYVPSHRSVPGPRRGPGPFQEEISGPPYRRAILGPSHNQYLG
ncbi:hypothetical protein KM043_003552 [Ampulex compressa]|nr:hypothetical protein KM043_003552 [Ampulex compressa]